ncbi:serine/threonine-protein kinase PBL34-like [Cannabis sativa]|uniref:serine/threonine-protein kinase PBL34-like n=1 Tax=Cannabis sativa TaxID=3483 RepID=UPI0029CA8827|nr:serine/threonine-protein kinase PBL34-like [Cannabis sativa]
MDEDKLLFIITIFIGKLQHYHHLHWQTPVLSPSSLANSRSKVSWARSLSVASSSLDSNRRSEFDSDSKDFSDFIGVYEFLSLRRANDLRVFTFSELKSATRGFSMALLFGEGGFGCVYRGVVKVSGSDVEIDDRTTTKMPFPHPNLVKLVGYCAEDDERRIQRLLDYELIYFLSLCTLVFLFFNVSPLSRFHRDNLFNNTITYPNETCRNQGASIFCPNVSLHF